MRILIGLFIVCSLGSCAVKNGILIKRKYNRGYYLNIASDKRSRTKQIDPLQQSQKEQIEIVQIAKEKETIATPEPVKIETSSANALSGNPKNTFWPEEVAHKKNFFSPKEKLQTAVSKMGSANRYADFKAGLYIILFVVFSFIYAFAIMSQSPGIPFGVALLIGVLCAALTMATGIVWL